MIERVNFERKTLKRGIAERVIDTKQFHVEGGGGGESFLCDFLDYLDDIEEGILWANNKLIVYRVRPKRIIQKRADVTMIPRAGMPTSLININLYNYWIGGTLMFISLSRDSGNVSGVYITKDTLRKPKEYDRWKEEEQANFVYHSMPFLQLNVYRTHMTVKHFDNNCSEFLRSLERKNKSVVVHKVGDDSTSGVLFANQSIYQLCYGQSFNGINFPSAKDTVSRIGEVVNRVLSAPFNRDLTWRNEIVPGCTQSSPEMNVNFIHKFFVKMSRLSDAFETGEQFERWYNSMKPKEIMQTIRQININAPAKKYLEIANGNVN